MFQAVHHWLTRGANPIGIDFGTDCLRMAQVDASGDKPVLVAAASVDVPAAVHDNEAERQTFFRDAAADLLATEGFKGNRAILALPAASTFVQHFKIQSGDPSIARDGILQAIGDVLPVDESDLLLRHEPVAPFDEPAREVIAIGSSRTAVVKMLTAAQAAGLDVVAMNTEPAAIADFYNHVYSRFSDQQSTTATIDLGFAGTRVFVIRNQKLLLAHAIPLGGRHLTQAVADAMNVSVTDARMLRLKHSRADADFANAGRHVLFVAPPAGGVDALRREQAIIDHAGAAVVASYCRLIKSTLAQFELSDNGSKVDRILFIGGESRDRRLCRQIANASHITAAVGDPLQRMGSVSEACVAGGIDRRQPQPSWAVAVGLSLGKAERPPSDAASPAPVIDRR